MHIVLVYPTETLTSLYSKEEKGAMKRDDGNYEISFMMMSYNLTIISHTAESIQVQPTSLHVFYAWI